jgi:competence protein ComEA
MDLDTVQNKLKPYLINAIMAMIVIILLLYYIYREDVLRHLIFRSSATSGIHMLDGTADSLPVPTSVPRTIFVDIDGAVMNPGVYEIEADQRINDLIVLAGGFTPDVNLAHVRSELNKAQKLTDATKIYIPYKNETVVVHQSQTQGETHKSSDRTNINTATKESLNELPGIGDITAEKIIDNRPYSAASELLSRKILTSSQYEKLKDLITN